MGWGCSPSSPPLSSSPNQTAAPTWLDCIACVTSRHPTTYAAGLPAQYSSIEQVCSRSRSSAKSAMSSRQTSLALGNARPAAQRLDTVTRYFLRGRRETWLRMRCEEWYQVPEEAGRLGLDLAGSGSWDDLFVDSLFSSGAAVPASLACSFSSEMTLLSLESISLFGLARGPIILRGRCH